MMKPVDGCRLPVIQDQVHDYRTITTASFAGEPPDIPDGQVENGDQETGHIDVSVIMGVEPKKVVRAVITLG